MNRMLTTLLILFAVALSVSAEEIVLKDGTKIVGRMAAISGDKIEVETAYGKMSVKRGDIVTITFRKTQRKALAQARSHPAGIRQKLKNTWMAVSIRTRQATSRSRCLPIGK